MMRDVQGDFSEMPLEFRCLFDNAEKPLFSGCTKYTKLSDVLKLYNLKAKNRWSDKSFTGLLELLKDMFPSDNELPHSTYEAKNSDNELPHSTYEAKKLLCPFPHSTYEAKKLLCPLGMDIEKAKKLLCPLGMDIEKIHACPNPLGMDIEKIHACPNDCILYWKEYKDLHVCPKCGTSRYKRKNVDDVGEGKKGPPAKVLWYLPVIPRFKRMFSNPKEAKNLQWHAIGRKDDGKLRHPADSPQWRNIDRRWPEFGTENRNLRLGLCTDGMNPHGPKQPGNDIDVYLAPLIEDLKMLWNEGVSVYDVILVKELRHVLFVKIILVKELRHVLFVKMKLPMELRAFLPDGHPYRKKKKAFNGKPETQVARLPLSGHAVYERVKNVDVAFGKTCKTTQKTLWKKRSIFWDLPYWKYLQVRHCIDVMHVENNVCDSIIGTLLNIQGKTKDGIKARKDMHMLPIAIPDILPKQVRQAITKLCFFFNAICMKVVDVDMLDALQADVVVTLCQLEMYFPPSFFDIMVHLIVHLVREIKITGPVFMRYMYPFERYMGILKGYVRNRYRPEGSIIEGYSSEEIIEFCSDYLAGVESIGVPKPRHEGRLIGKGTIGLNYVLPPLHLRDKAHHLVLEHLSEVHPYLDQHMSMIRQQNPSKGERWVAIEHNRTFI
ncbi:uncharacterized protein LOC116011274 [Ipomoea triloba]|uniref:uncharacterized protein LOC116011274 n=1 Tax=Ipomoea triloba TaxID=35885 RepID=UPI00125D65F4|nr:uncharacterized protein LOC116011274 [Ipomoea triloba]